MHAHQAIRLRDWICVWVEKSCHPCFTCPCFRSPVHGNGAWLRTTALVCCSGIVSRWERRKSDWNSWSDLCSKLVLHCKQWITGLRLWKQRQVLQQHHLLHLITQTSMRSEKPSARYSSRRPAANSWSIMVRIFSRTRLRTMSRESSVKSLMLRVRLQLCPPWMTEAWR